MAMTLGFLGPEGTFSEQAALTYCSEAELVPIASIPEVADPDRIGVGRTPVIEPLAGMRPSLLLLNGVKTSFVNATTPA